MTPRAMSAGVSHSWQGHPSRTGRRVEARLRVIPNLHLGAGIGGVQQTGSPAAPCNSCQTKVVMGSLMPLEVHLAGVKMVGVRTAHPHPHLNPHLCASFLLPPPKKSPVAMWNGGGHRLRMWLGVPSQTMHTGGNGVLVVEIAGWSSASPRQLPL